MNIVLENLSVRERKRFYAIALQKCDIEPRMSATFAEVSPDTVKNWQMRQVGDLDISDAARCGRPRMYTKDSEDRIIAFYCQTTPLPGNGRWSLRWAEQELSRQPELVQGIPSRSTIQRVLERHHLRPHLNRYFLQTTDPDFFPKLERLIALYRSPPKNLFCFDESPGIQVLQRMSPEIRPSQAHGVKEQWREFEYIRNGTTDLFCFFDVATGRMAVGCHPDHKKETFLQEFRNHADCQAEDEQLDYIMDNLDSHCCYEFCELVAELSRIDCPPRTQLNTREKRREWLQRYDKRVVIHFTPFHGSWLNMAEICFNIIGEKCFKNSYDSPYEMISAIHATVEKWNTYWAHPFNWEYDGVGLHSKAVERFSAMLKYSLPQMSLQHLTKSCNLMCNLLSQYSNEVQRERWEELFTIFLEKHTELKEKIERSERPIVKRRAREAVERFYRQIPKPADLEAAA